MRSLMTATLLLASTVLVACGGATVEESASSTSIAPITREASKTSASATSTSASAAASSSSAPTAGAGGQNQTAPVRDGQSEEISELPTTNGGMTDLDRELIDGLKEQGLDVSEIEQQLIGAAHLVCADGSNPVRKAAIEAVAGQLIEQGRIDKSFEETVALIDSKARDAYC